MTQSVRKSFLDSFDLRLPETEQLIAVAEILKRAGEMNYPPLDDETIDRIAERAFPGTRRRGSREWPSLNVARSGWSILGMSPRPDLVLC